ncbi:MAG: MOSC domain-containing protein [Tissierellia bacterium]|nr:MOSC domain-containing protein [Tissierellia bacterium]
MNKYNSVGEVVAIYIQNKKEEPYRLMKEGIFQKDKGLLGDIHSKGGKRQVSIFSTDGREEIVSLDTKGLCVKKFHENIRVKNLDTSNLTIGSKIVIGETIQEITEIGKRCFPECKIIKEGKNCALSTQVVFTKVIKGGKVKIGDILR